MLHPEGIRNTIHCANLPAETCRIRRTRSTTFTKKKIGGTLHRIPRHNTHNEAGVPDVWSSSSSSDIRLAPESELSSDAIDTRQMDLVANAASG